VCPLLFFFLASCHAARILVRGRRGPASFGRGGNVRIVFLPPFFSSFSFSWPCDHHAESERTLPVGACGRGDYSFFPPTTFGLASWEYVRQKGWFRLLKYVRTSSLPTSPILSFLIGDEEWKNRQ